MEGVVWEIGHSVALMKEPEKFCVCVSINWLVRTDNPSSGQKSMQLNSNSLSYPILLHLMHFEDG